MDAHDKSNAEGYCKKCGQALGIAGICYVCEINTDDFHAMMKRVTTCPICGMKKTHHRLYGYRCDNPEHAEMEHELERQQLRKPPRKY